MASEALPNYLLAQQLVLLRRALTVADQTRLRQLVAPRQGLRPIGILERQSGQRASAPGWSTARRLASARRARQRAEHADLLDAPPQRGQRGSSSDPRLEHSSSGTPETADRWLLGSALFLIPGAGHIMGSRLEPRHSQLRLQDQGYSTEYFSS